MRYRVDHETRLEFSQAVYEHHCEMRMTPRQDAAQRVLEFSLSVNPSTDVHSYIDSFGNAVHTFAVLPPHGVLVTRMVCEVETTLENPFNYSLMTPTEENAWYAKTLRDDPMLLQYVVHRSPQTPDLARVLPAGLKPPSRNKDESLQVSIFQTIAWIRSHFRFQPGSSETHSPLVEVFQTRSGVCQDFAHLLITIVRSWGIPARYVMGYSDPGNLPPGDQASHAWAEILIPDGGWRGFDATNGLAANDAYIAVAVGRHSQDAAPQRGTFKSGAVQQSPHVKLSVTPYIDAAALQNAQ